MAELDPIEQEFIANVERYVGGLEEMSAAADQFIRKNHDEVVSVEELQASIDSLHGNTVEIHVDTSGVAQEMLASISSIESASDDADAGVRKLADSLKRFDAIAGGRTAYSYAAQMNQASAAQAESVSVLSAKQQKLDELKDAIDEVGLSEEEVARLAAVSGSALFRQGEAASTKADKIRELMSIYDVLTNHEESSLWLFRSAADGMEQTAQATENGGREAERYFHIWGTGIRVTGYGLHWLITGILEFAAVAIPAIIAFGSAVGVMAQGAVQMFDRVAAVMASTAATSQMLHKSTSDVLGFKGALQQAQATATPGVWELLGAAVSGSAESMGSFWQSGLRVLQIVDRFAAEIDIALGPGGSLAGASGAVGAMVTDLQQLGQVLGNLSHFILNIAGEAPGVAEALLSLLSSFTRVLSVLTQPAWYNFGGSLITILMGMEELSRWGGLVFRMLSPLVVMLGTLAGRAGEVIISGSGLLDVIGAENVVLSAQGAAARVAGESLITVGADAELAGEQMAQAGAMTRTLSGAMRMLFTTPIGWITLSTVAFMVFADKTHLATSGVNGLLQSMSTINTTLDKDTPVKALQDLVTAAQQLNKTKIEPDQNMGFWGQMLQGASNILAGFTGGTYGPLGKLNIAASAYNSTLSRVVGTTADLLSANIKIGKTYYNTTEAIGLATAAGVTMNDMFQKNGQLSKVAAQQIQNLVYGYRSMAQTGSVLTQDINAINVQALDQQTAISKLNQAWDSFLSNMTGGTGALAGLNSDLKTIGNITTDATSKISAFSQQANGMSLSVRQISEHLQSFKGTSAQVWQNYNSAITQAGTLTDWLRTAASEGAVGTKQFTMSIRGVVSELLPYAAHSKTAVSELDALAEQAGGPVTNSYKKLSEWVGNTKTDQKDLNDTVEAATQYMSNLGVVAANLSSTLDGEVDSALAQGAVNVRGITGAAEKFTKQLQSGKTWTSGYAESVRGMVRQLHDAGEPAKDIIGVMDTMAKRAHLNSQQVQQLNSMIRELVRQMSRIHDVSATVSINEQIHSTGRVPYGITASTAGGGRAKGWRVPGYGGGDRVPAMLEPGEAVVPKHLVPSVAPFLGAHHVPGFAQGGPVGGDGHSLGHPEHRHRNPGHSLGHPEDMGPMAVIIEDWSRRIWHGERERYGAHSPVSLARMRQLFGPASLGDSGLLAHPQYRRLIMDERLDMSGYFAHDRRYWKIEDRMAKLQKTEDSTIAKYEKDIRQHKGAENEKHWESIYRSDIAEYRKKLAAEKDAKWRKIYEQDIARYEAKLKAEPDYFKNLYESDIRNVRQKDLLKMAGLEGRLLDVFGQMGYGYSRGGLIPFGHYDQGGFLPNGLSMALNTTGRPEPVGGGGGSRTVHVHIEVSGKEIANAILPDLVGSANRYAIRNSGKSTGILRPS